MHYYIDVLPANFAALQEADHGRWQREVQALQCEAPQEMRELVRIDPCMRCQRRKRVHIVLTPSLLSLQCKKKLKKFIHLS